MSIVMNQASVGTTASLVGYIPPAGYLIASGTAAVYLGTGTAVTTGTGYQVTSSAPVVWQNALAAPAVPVYAIASSTAATLSFSFGNGPAGQVIAGGTAALQLDHNAGDIQPVSTAPAAGSSGLASDAKHVHVGMPLPSGSATAGYVPVASGTGATSTWTAVGVPLKSGWFYPVDAAGGNCTYAYNTMEVFPFDCGRSITLAELAINMKNAGSPGTTIRLGVYASGTDGNPGSLLVDGGTVAGDSTGVMAVTGLTTAVPPGRVWIGSVWQGTNGTAPQSQGYDKALASVGWSSYQQFPPVVGFQYSGIAGTLPASLPTPTSIQNNVVGAVQFAPQ